MLLLLFLTSLFRGNGKNPSVVGVTKCKPNDHIIFASLLLGGIILTVIGGIVVQREYKKKVELRYNFVKGDVLMTWCAILKLSSIALLGGFISGGFGVGAALIFNPTLVQYDIHPMVASGTGMFITMFGAISSTCIVMIFGKLNLWYALVLCIMAGLGSFFGLFMQYKIV